MLVDYNAGTQNFTRNPESQMGFFSAPQLRQQAGHTADVSYSAFMSSSALLPDFIVPTADPLHARVVNFNKECKALDEIIHNPKGRNETQKYFQQESKDNLNQSIKTLVISVAWVIGGIALIALGVVTVPVNPYLIAGGAFLIVVGLLRTINSGIRIHHLRQYIAKDFDKIELETQRQKVITQWEQLNETAQKSAQTKLPELMFKTWFPSYALPGHQPASNLEQVF